MCSGIEKGLQMTYQIQDTGHAEAFIKSHGYRIDTRGPYFTLIKGVRATNHETLREALDAAIEEINAKKGN
jgi:hypothetical protein